MLVKLIIHTLVLLSLLSCKVSKELEAQYKKASIYYANHELDKALVVLKKIEKESPGLYNTELLMGKIYYFQLEFKKAKTYFDLFCSENPQNLNGMHWQIKTEYLLGEMEAKTLLLLIGKYLMVDSNNMDILYIQGKTFLKLKKVNQALQSFQSILLNTKTLASTYHELSKIYEISGLENKANQYRRISEVLKTK